MAKANRDRKAQEARDVVLAELPEICRDMIALVRSPKTPPTARVQLISHLFRAAGLYAADESERHKEPHEMTPEELQKAIADAEARAAAFKPGPLEDDPDDGDIMA